jgi:hypothetical protein|tara:strand:+ start:8120 stop:8470 length:351 start_codon:yes stop_codon:yes gene_type:complete
MVNNDAGFVERRQHPRIISKIIATFTDDSGKQARSLIYDISIGGANAECFFSPRVGTRLLVSFLLTLDDEKHKIDAISEVVHCICIPDEKRFSVGLSFLKLARNGAELIQQYIDTH